MKRQTEMTRTKGGVVHPPVMRAIAKLGADISVARRARRISAQNLADRMGVSRGTIHRLEKGEAGVSINTLGMALASLGMLGRLAGLVDQASDDVGLMISRGKLPGRVSGSRSPRNVDGKSFSSPRLTSTSAGTDAKTEEPEGW